VRRQLRPKRVFFRRFPGSASLTRSPTHTWDCAGLDLALGPAGATCGPQLQASTAGLNCRRRWAASPPRNASGAATRLRYIRQPVFCSCGRRFAPMSASRRGMPSGAAVSATAWRSSAAPPRRGFAGRCSGLRWPAMGERGATCGSARTRVRRPAGRRGHACVGLRPGGSTYAPIYGPAGARACGHADGVRVAE